MKWLGVAILFVLISCSSENEHYKIVQFGTSEKKADKNDAILYVELFESDDDFKIIHPHSSSEIKVVLYDLCIGDVAELKDPKKFGFKEPTSVSVINTKDSDLVQRFEEGLKDLKGEEKIWVTHYLFRSIIPFESHRGMFVHWKNRSKSGVKGIKNSIYKLDMECELLDGTKIFSTDKSNSLFEFNKSMPGQITEGLARIMEEMEEGDEINLLVPSSLSFGEKGVGDTIVPPNSPLFYNIKLVEIII